ncbi:MAG: DUF1573 domain-containing protein [Flavipsychrobacter sp.]|nr:DUF1573 domain-containing protein [Flavipsychrobacter sp.]
MKKIVFAFILACSGVGAAYAQQPAAAAQINGPHMKFSGTEKFDFGTIEERDAQYEHKFEFTNTGNAPLIIQNVTAGCSCTTGDFFPKAPIPPGKSGYILVKYASKGKVAPFNKEVFIKSNATQVPYSIFIKGEVVAPK